MVSCVVSCVVSRVVSCVCSCVCSCVHACMSVCVCVQVASKEIGLCTIADICVGYKAKGTNVSTNQIKYMPKIVIFFLKITHPDK